MLLFSKLCFWLDVSHLNPTVPQPTTTPTSPATAHPNTSDPVTVPDACTGVECLNDGVCVVDDGKATCRCVFWGCHSQPKSGAMLGFHM